jgi:hypothetical protein
MDGDATIKRPVDRVGSEVAIGTTILEEMPVERIPTEDICLSHPV